MQTSGLLAATEPPPPRQIIGFVTSVTGSDVKIELPPSSIRATVGRYVRIATGTTNLIGTLTKLAAREQLGSVGQVGWATANLGLVGEIASDGRGSGFFRRGVTDYPVIGDAVELVDSRELDLVYRGGGQQTIEIGTLHQDQAVPGTVHVNELLNKHFAVLGTTGVGKSSGVAVLLDGIMTARPDLRVFLLDTHNEYGRCFGERAQVISPRTLKLPFWLFNFEEFVDVVYGGRPPVAEEVEILAELIPLAKGSYGQYKAADRTSVRREARVSGFTVDTPVPYLLQDLIGLIDERMGRLDNRASRMIYHRLMGRIETIRNDPRYAFMFQNANVGGDTMSDLLVQLFRLEPDGKPMCVMQLAGLPAEVTDAVVSVLCRLAFDFGMWSEGVVPLLFVCEEAHRYASADHAIGFHPTRRALARIAKEGRKHGVFLGLVTQRPAELDPTIISQCSTLFAMRMSNDRDQALLRSAVSDDVANLLSFVPSLGTREVIGFGEGMTLPTRIIFKTLAPDRVPRSEAFDMKETAFHRGEEREFVRSVVDRWRGATLGARQKPDEVDPEPVATAPLQPRPSGIDPARYRLLKRPLENAEFTSPGHAHTQR